VIRALHLHKRSKRSAACVVLAGVLIAIALLLEGTQTTARAWLLCFVIFSGVPLGSLVLLMIHRLTGGAWGFALAPFLRPVALCIPILAIAFIPLVLAMRTLYPWANDAGAAHLYLNAPSFFVRAAIAIIGWSILAVIFGRGKGSQLLAALGLAFYGLTISFVAIDWFLSIDPHYTSSAFGATIAIQQILTALAAAALFGPGDLREPDLGDLAGFLIAALLGVIYLALMTFIVQWYGNLPDRAHWFLLRSQNGWTLVIVGCAILAIAAFAMLLLPSVRHSRGGLRLAGAVILTAVGLHLSWLIVPAYPSQVGVIVAALLCSVATVLVSAPVIVAMQTRLQQAAAHAG
jgi:hypothetical protein